MKAGDMIRVKTGSGCFEDGEETTCYWPESKGQIGVIVEMIVNLSFSAARIMVLDELAEFDVRGLEVINESR